MDIETFRSYCLARKGVTEEMPFGPDTLVFKLMGKIFALAALDEFPLRVNLKCDPEEVVALREQYPDRILPGYHQNKKHWNTLILDGFLSNSLIFELTDHSYDMVFKGLTKKLQAALKDL